jgi:hypothetical protein
VAILQSWLDERRALLAKGVARGVTDG